MNKKTINLITIGIVAVVLIPVIIGAWSAGIFVVLGILAFVALLLVGIIYGGKAMMNLAKPKTIENGMPATATVVSCSQGNMKMTFGVTEVYKLKIEVNVTNPQGETWAATISEMIPLTQIAVFQPGVSFAVQYDPNDKTKVIIDQTKGAQSNNGTGNSMDIPGYGTVNSQMANAAKQVAPQDITLRVMAESALMKELATIGVSTKATIISNNLVYANYMNGTDVYQLKVMVNSTDRPEFEAEVTFLIGKSSLFKIEPGKTIFVKYDGNNASRLCITGLDKENSAVEL